MICFIVIKIIVSDFSMCIRKITVLVVGLDNAGKTCTVKSIMKGNLKLIIIKYLYNYLLI